MALQPSIKLYENTACVLIYILSVTIFLLQWQS